MSVIGACHFRLNVCLNGLQPEHILYKQIIHYKQFGNDQYLYVGHLCSDKWQCNITIKGHSKRAEPMKSNQLLR